MFSRTVSVIRVIRAFRSGWARADEVRYSELGRSVPPSSSCATGAAVIGAPTTPCSAPARGAGAGAAAASERRRRARRRLGRRAALRRHGARRRREPRRARRSAALAADARALPAGRTGPGGGARPRPVHRDPPSSRRTCWSTAPIGSGSATSGWHGCSPRASGAGDVGLFWSGRAGSSARQGRDGDRAGERGRGLHQLRRAAAPGQPSARRRAHRYRRLPRHAALHGARAAAPAPTGDRAQRPVQLLRRDVGDAARRAPVHRPRDRALDARGPARPRPSGIRTAGAALAAARPRARDGAARRGLLRLDSRCCWRRWRRGRAASGWRPPRWRWSGSPPVAPGWRAAAPPRFPPAATPPPGWPRSGARRSGRCLERGFTATGGPVTRRPRPRRRLPPSTATPAGGARPGSTPARRPTAAAEQSGQELSPPGWAASTIGSTAWAPRSASCPLRRTAPLSTGPGASPRARRYSATFTDAANPQLGPGARIPERARARPPCSGAGPAPPIPLPHLPPPRGRADRGRRRCRRPSRVPASRPGRRAPVSPGRQPGAPRHPGRRADAAAVD